MGEALIRDEELQITPIERHKSNHPGIRNRQKVITNQIMCCTKP
jgi:hypothetical protein